MPKLIFIFALWATFIQDASPQSYLTIKGLVTDSSGNALCAATVRLTILNDTLYTLTSEDGSFVIKRLNRKDFHLLITMNGYSPYEMQYLINTPALVYQIGHIVLKVAYTDLAKVNVTAVKPIVIKEDTIEYSALAYHVRDGSELEDLLKQLPGMEVRMDGKVTILGKDIDMLMVDGKEFFGGDMSIALQNLPADIIAKVQVVDDYGDQARLTGIKIGEPRKILNIELKKDKRRGEFGNTRAAGGTKQRYTGNASLNSFHDERQLSMVVNANNASESGSSPGNTVIQSGGVNYSDRWNQKWSGNGVNTFNKQEGVLENSVSQETYYATEKDFGEQNNNSINRTFKLQSNYKLQYQSLPSIVLRVEPSFQFEQGKMGNSANFSIIQEDSNFQRTSTGTSIEQSDINAISAGSKLYFQKIYPASGRRLSINANFNYSENRVASDNLTTSITIADNMGDSTLLNYRVKNTNYTDSMGATLNFYEPLGKKSFFELSSGFRQGITLTSNTTSQPDSSNSNPIFIDSLSSNFQTQSFTQQIHAGYITATQKISLHLAANLQSGSLATQYFVRDTDTRYSYINFTPAIQISYAFSRLEKINLGYSTTTTQPQPDQLQPVANVTNPEYPVIGNPALKTAFSHTLNLQYEKSSLSLTKYYGFALGIHVTEKDNQIIENIIHPQDNNSVIQETTYENANGFYSLGVDLHINFPPIFQKRLKISTWSSLVDNQSISMLDSIASPIMNLVFTQNIDMYYSLKDLLDLNLSTNYVSNNIHYSANTGVSGQSSTLLLRMEANVNFLRKWTIKSNFSQSFMRGVSLPVKTSPPLFNASIQKMFFKGNGLTLKFAGYNILNGNTGVTQFATANSIGQSHTIIIGRFFLFSVLIKVSRFHQ